MKELFFFHCILSCILLNIGEYTLSISLQIVFLFTLFESKKVFYLLYFCCIQYSLVLIFASGSFILYFFILLLSLFFILKSEIFLQRYEYIIFSVLSVLIAAVFMFAQEFVFELYLYLDIVDEVNHLSVEIFYILSLIHLCMVIALMIKREDIVNFKNN